MVRHINKHEIQKRLSIRLAKQREPSLTTRLLARQFHTSLRVVGDALSADVSDWQDELERFSRPASKPNDDTIKATPAKHVAPAREQLSTPKRSTRAFNPEEDFDADEYYSSMASKK
nr:hypothetical protein [Candidatus Sigynarchaeum springense]